jgi:hypothetical protein
VVPPAVAERYTEPLDLDNPDLAADSLLKRAAWVERHAPAAANNLSIAQHRDNQWYARRRSGAYIPKARRFAPGDFVYYQREPANTLEPSVARGVYRITSTSDAGVCELMGRCGRTFKAHYTTLAPCHLPIDDTVDHTAARPPPDEPCVLCQGVGDDQWMLLCDGCGKGYHTYCLGLEGIPDAEIWVCPTCVGNKVTAQTVRQRQQHVANILKYHPETADQEAAAKLAKTDRVNTEAARKQLAGSAPGTATPRPRPYSTHLGGGEVYGAKAWGQVL